MLFRLEVLTQNKTIQEVTDDAVKKLQEAVKRLSRPCEVCGTAYLSERRGRKKYCSDACRYKAVAQTSLNRYYKNRKGTQKRDEAKRAAKAALLKGAKEIRPPKLGGGKPKTV